MTAAAAGTDPDIDARARRLIASSLVWDNHTCMPLRPGDASFLPQLERVHRAGIDVVSVNAGFGPQPLDAHVRMLASLRRWIAAHGDRFLLAREIADIERARSDGKLAVTFDVEGMAPLDNGDDGLVAMLRDLGVGWMLVAYNRNNAAGGGCYDDDPGLSAHGRRILDEMRRVGMVVCCSHTGHRTALDVFAAAGNPVIFSHSNPSAVHAHTRNISDELMRGCAATGGVIGINGIGPFLGPNDNRPETLVRHIDYAVELVGADHVGIGLDYVFDEAELRMYLEQMRETFPGDAAFREPALMVAPEALVEIAAGLCRRGYADADVCKILGGNWLRVAARVWR